MTDPHRPAGTRSADHEANQATGAAVTTTARWVGRPHALDAGVWVGGPKDGPRTGRRGRGALFAAALAAAAFLLVSCERAGRDPGAQDDIGEPTPERQEQATSPSESYANLERVTRRPRIFYGERVTVDGKVGHELSPNVFSLTGEEAAQSGEAFEVEAALVAGEDGSVPDLSEGERVRVTGEVRELNLRDIERRFGVELDDSLRREYEDRPAIYPASVARLAGEETTGR